MIKIQASKTDDPLSDALSSLHMGSTVLGVFRMCEPWAIEHPKLEVVLSHIVLDGETWCYGDNLPTIHLRKGDLVTFPCGASHSLASKPGLSGKPVASLLRSIGHRLWSPQHHSMQPVRFSSGEGACNSLILDIVSGVHEPCRNPLLCALPNILHVSAADHGLLPVVSLLIDTIGGDDALTAPGYAAAARCLADLAFIQSVRAFLQTRDFATKGCLRGLVHPRIGRALQAVHRNPGRNWTVASLAAHANMSRSPFSSCFLDCVGQTPMNYVTQWRMHVAARRLASGASLQLVSEELGYASTVTLSRTFTRVMGFSPTRISNPR